MNAFLLCSYIFFSFRFASSSLHYIIRSNHFVFSAVGAYMVEDVNIVDGYALLLSQNMVMIAENLHLHVRNVTFSLQIRSQVFTRPKYSLIFSYEYLAGSNLVLLLY